jgi:hypothetical protein
MHEAGWTASIVIEDGDGGRRTRVIAAKSCSALAEAAALVVAMALRDGPAEEPIATEPEAVEPPKPPLIVRTERDGARRAALPSAIAVGAGFTGLAGVMPETVPGLGAWAAWLSGRARIALSAYGTAAQTALAPNGASGAELRLVGAAARGCWTAIASHRFDLGPCVGFDILRISSVGTGITAPREATTWDGAASLGALATFALDGSLVLTVAADALAPTSRPRFVLEGEPLTVLHRPAAVWGRLLLGGEIRF